MLEIAFETLSDSFVVAKARVRFAMSEPFRAEVHVLSENESVDLEALLGETALLRVSPVELPSAEWEGVCTEAELIESEPNGRSTYRLEIHSRVWLLSQRETC